MAKKIGERKEAASKAGRGRPYGGVELQPKTYNIPRKIAELLSGEAEHQGMSQSEFLTTILIEYIAEHDIRPRPKRKSVAELAKEKGVEL